MNKTLIILKHEFFKTIRSKSFIITTLSIPLLALIGMLAYEIIHDVTSEPSTHEERRIGYVDGTGLFTGFTERPGNFIFVVYADENAARSDLLGKGIEEYFVIPSGYLQTGQVTRYTTKRELETPISIQVQIVDFLQSNLLNGKIDPELSGRIKAPMDLTSLYVDQKGEVSKPRDPDIVIMVPYVFGIIFMLSLMFTSGYLLQSVAEEKENRIMEILLSSVSSGQLLRGKILGLGAAGLVQIVVWFATARVFSGVASVRIDALSDLSIPTSMLIFGLIYFVLGYLLFAVLYAGVGAIFTSARESQQWSSLIALPAVLPPMLLLGEIAEHPNGVAATILTFVPITAPVSVIMRLPNTNVPAWELVLSMVIMASAIAAGIWFVAKIFRVYLLMYGKRPSVKEIIRYVREG